MFSRISAFKDKKISNLHIKVSRKVKNQIMMFLLIFSSLAVSIKFCGDLAKFEFFDWAKKLNLDRVRMNKITP